MMDDGCPFLISHTFDARTSRDREWCEPRLHEDVETRRVQRIKGVGFCSDKIPWPAPLDISSTAASQRRTSRRSEGGSTR
jgi:hypothetical protein